MPHSFSCERILATVDWAHAELREQGRFSGYAMDSLLACVDKETSRPGLFARYLRGENSPSRKMLKIWRTAMAARQWSEWTCPCTRCCVAGMQIF